MSNAEKRYGFMIGFVIIFALNIAIYVAAHIVFKNRPSNTFFGSSQNSIMQNIAYFLLLLELIFFGLVQYLYIAPLIHWQSTKGNQKVVSGMFICSLFVLVANCCLFYFSLNPIG